MNRYRIIAAVLCCLCLLGCDREENPYKVDTVVRIPVDPTEEIAETAAATETPPEEPTEAPATEVSTEPTEAASESSGKKTSSTKKTTSSKKNSSGKTSSKTEKPKETELPTQPPTEAEETTPPTEPAFDPSDYSAGKLEYAILDEMNACREENETAQLKMSAKLCGIAALRAREAARVWSHTRPDGSSYTSAMSEYGCSFSTSAEILAHASGSGKASSIVEKWMKTDSKEDILNGDYTKAGVGIYRADGTVWVAVLLVG